MHCCPECNFLIQFFPRPCRSSRGQQVTDSSPSSPSPSTSGWTWPKYHIFSSSGRPDQKYHIFRLGQTTVQDLTSRQQLKIWYFWKYYIVQTRQDQKYHIFRQGQYRTSPVGSLKYDILPSSPLYKNLHLTYEASLSQDSEVATSSELYKGTTSNSS